MHAHDHDVLPGSNSNTTCDTSALIAMIQPFLQPQLSVKPVYEILRRLVHLKHLLLLHRLPCRYLHAPPFFISAAGDNSFLLLLLAP